ncbi:MAG: serpin B [Cognaticolwellia sp.]|jgi:serpin B
MKKYFFQINIIFCLILINQFAFGQSNIKESSKSFSFDLYKKLRTANKDGNLFFSPFSISSAFAMPYAGATGLTQTQLHDVFYYDDNAKRNLKQYRDFTNDFERSRGVTIRIANGMWLDETMPINKKFIQTTRQLTGRDEIHKVAFTKNYKAGRSQINQWISDKTEGNIKGLIQEGSINELTRFVMANAIYFQGSWAIPFDNKLTATNSFYGLNDKMIETQFMTKKVADHKYYENDNYQILELPYEGESTSMVIVLPRFANGLDKIENSLSKATYQQWLKAMTKRPVVVTIPKFHLKIQYNMRSTFRKMGLKEPFTHASAFDGISTQSLRLSNIFHQAFIIVSEEGTEAAEATAVIGQAKGRLKPRPAFFNANQPFLFFIKDNKTDMILFMGRMTEPEHNATITYTTDIQPERFTEIPLLKGDKIHWVEKGESLYGISKKYSVTIDQVRLLNKMAGNNVKIGQELLIQEGERSTLEEKGNKTKIPVILSSTHEVNPGESLFSIAKKYNLTVDELKALNGMTNNTIFIGTEMIVKVVEKSNKNMFPVLSKPNMKQLTPKPKPASIKQNTYIVQKGDTLWKISKQFNVSVDQIKKVNNLASDALTIGQELTMN